MAQLLGLSDFWAGKSFFSSVDIITVGTHLEIKTENNSDNLCDER